MCELEASNNTERSNKIETLLKSNSFDVLRTDLMISFPSLASSLFIPLPSKRPGQLHKRTGYR